LMADLFFGGGGALVSCRGTVRVSFTAHPFPL
jgi:hypothetical protein